jgi:hypothetical protein
VRIEGDVENWLTVLEKEMKITLDDLLKQSLRAKGIDIENLPSQICCLTMMI